ncbi:unnamed protein product [Caenorhabditis bovis]|uniref:Uncharacterized protein n=1 Tax=Caenorhabditis bovis TaxID=2654633 RepID=A0A8S1FCH5_9PELO|nr:unnamed protein product [Caenorhabditis bovis]
MIRLIIFVCALLLISTSFNKSEHKYIVDDFERDLLSDGYRISNELQYHHTMNDKKTNSVSCEFEVERLEDHALANTTLGEVYLLRKDFPCRYLTSEQRFEIFGPARFEYYEKLFAMTDEDIEKHRRALAIHLALKQFKAKEEKDWTAEAEKARLFREKEAAIARLSKEELNDGTPRAEALTQHAGEHNIMICIILALTLHN